MAAGAAEFLSLCGAAGLDAILVGEIDASLLETRSAKDRFDVLGRLKNHGTRTWNRVTVEAEVYGQDGAFVDEASTYVWATLSPDAEEHFRLSFENPDEHVLDKSSKVVLKVTDAEDDQF